ncbi:MAG: hypothetical protein NT104_03070 [Bacteroidetes bacterium]|nr:hypothetical protein [Bacteroidota bacterium]
MGFIRKLFLSFFFLIVIQSAYAQNEEEVTKQWVYDENERTYNWVPTLLKSNKNILSSISQFNGYVFNWVPRGQSYDNSAIIDGINWASNLNGWNASFSYTGMYKIFHQKESDENLAYSSEGYGKNYRTSYLTTNSNLFKRGWVLHTGFSNASYMNEGHIQYSAAGNRNEWSLHSFLVFQNTPNGMSPSGFKKIKGAAFSIDKIFTNNQSIGLTLWWNQTSQGKQAPSVLEAYTLSHQRNYNPSWGWLDGQAYYPNSKYTNVPVLSIRYEKNWSDKAAIQINLGLAIGEQGTSQLDWTSSADPRPDYYRYLPSYSKDSSMRIQLNKWFEANPQALQIDFDRIQKINKASISKRSFYIINKNISNIISARASAIYKFQLNNYWSTNAGMQIAKDKINYFNVVDHLLGGHFFYNYNGWVIDDGLVNSFQNNIQSPDQKIKEGERWGPNFELQSMQATSWLQVKNTSPRWEFSTGFNYATDLFQRNGLNQNGLFLNNSLGRSSLLYFPSLGYKGEVLYKFSGRIYARSIFFNQQYAPNAATVFLDPSLHGFQTPFLLPLLKNGIDLSLYFRGVDTKIMLSAYYQKVKNESEKRFFYHDKYNSFVYGVVGQKESVYQGVESSVETLLFNLLQLELSINIGKYFISNNPLYEILLANDIYKVESGLLRLKNLPATTSPEITEAVSIQMQPTYTTRVSVTGIYAAKRAISYDYYRRSALVLDPLSAQKLYASLHEAHYLPSQFVLNASFSKSFNLKYGNQKIPIYSNFSFKNLLGTLIPVLVFEQSRFDYINLNPNKYPLKYLYDLGVTYAVGIQLQIQ